MKSRIRLFAGMITCAGAAVLIAPGSAHSTMLDPLDDDSRKTYCCAVDTDGDKRGDTWCCYSTGCSIDATGCRRVTEE